MDNENTFNQVKEALEIASRIESLKNYIHQRKQDITFKDDAAHRVRIEEADSYVALDRLSKILYAITVYPYDNWKDTKFRDLVRDLMQYVR